MASRLPSVAAKNAAHSASSGATSASICQALRGRPWTRPVPGGARCVNTMATTRSAAMWAARYRSLGRRASSASARELRARRRSSLRAIKVRPLVDVGSMSRLDRKVLTARLATARFVETKACSPPLDGRRDPRVGGPDAGGGRGPSASRQALVRAANTHCVARHSQRLNTQPRFRMPVRTMTKLHLTTDSSSSECTPPNPQTIDDSSMYCRARLDKAPTRSSSGVGPPYLARAAVRSPGRPLRRRWRVLAPLNAL